MENTSQEFNNTTEPNLGNLERDVPGAQVDDGRAQNTERTRYDPEAEASRMVAPPPEIETGTNTLLEPVVVVRHPVPEPEVTKSTSESGSNATEPTVEPASVAAPEETELESPESSAEAVDEVAVEAPADGPLTDNGQEVALAPTDALTPDEPEQEDGAPQAETEEAVPSDAPRAYPAAVGRAAVPGAVLPPAAEAPVQTPVEAGDPAPVADATPLPEGQHPEPVVEPEIVEKHAPAREPIDVVPVAEGDSEVLIEALPQPVDPYVPDDAPLEHPEPLVDTPPEYKPPETPARRVLTAQERDRLNEMYARALETGSYKVRRGLGRGLVTVLTHGFGVVMTPEWVREAKVVEGTVHRTGFMKYTMMVEGPNRGTFSHPHRRPQPVTVRVPSLALARLRARVKYAWGNH